MFKIGDYVDIIGKNDLNDHSIDDEYKDVFGIIVSFDDKDDCFPLTIDILNLDNLKVYNGCNPYLYEKKSLPEKYFGAYQKLIQEGLYAKITKYFDFEAFKKMAYNEEVFFNPIMDELRKQQCLCLNCASLIIKKDEDSNSLTNKENENCSIASALFQICVKNNMAMMITRCKEFKLKPAIHEMLISSELFETASKGKNNYRIRTNDARRKAMHIGDYIKLIKEPEHNESIMLEIIDKIEASSFVDLYNMISKEKLGSPDKTSVELANTMRRFYSEEQENELGVVAIETKVVGKLINEKPFVKELNKKDSSTR